MKTDDLINALAADTSTARPPIAQTLTLAFAAGLVVATLLFVWQIGVRADFMTVITQSWEFGLKFIVTLGLAIPAYFIVKRAARPDGDAASWAPVLFAAPAVLIAAMVYEFVQMPAETAAAIVMAPNWTKCVMLIPLLSIAPFIAIFYALRSGAPSNPALAGGLAGLLASATAATLYAAHCDIDSPLFVGVWYSFGIAAVTLVGALLGPRLLRW